MDSASLPEPESVLAITSHLIAFFSDVKPLIPTYAHLLLSALFPIFTGAHASLSRPSSAARAKRRRKTKDGKIIEVEDEEPEHRMEGLSNWDVIMFPVLAGCTLAGLYFLIKWLGNVELLNKILNWYIAFFSLASVSKLVSDALDVLHSLLFPHDYIDQGIVFHVDPLARRALPTSPAPASQIRKSALPGFLSRLPLPNATQNILWTLYALPSRRLTFGIHIHSICSFKVELGIHGIEGIAAGILSVVWYNFFSKPWWLTNLMGFGFSYTALQITSPSTFGTGSMLLIGLFFYDIYFVFFTPMMVTVAKELDIPVKLLFPRPPSAAEPSDKQALSMLGLGDVVLPGTLIGLALRFDLFMFYLRKQQKQSTVRKEHSSFNVDESESDPFTTTEDQKSTPEIQTKPEEEELMVKATYVPVGECWGDRFWTGSLFKASKKGYQASNAFPKPYFHASLTGYVVAMLATLTAMQLTDHPQPALLYLTPAVVGSVWIKALLRGELKDVWQFSDQEQDEDDQKDKNDGESCSKDSSTSTTKELKLGHETESQASKKDRSSFFSTTRQIEREQRVDEALRNRIKTDGDSDMSGDEDVAEQLHQDTKPEAGEDPQQFKKTKTSRTLLSLYIRLPPPLEDAGIRDHAEATTTTSNQ